MTMTIPSTPTLMPLDEFFKSSVYYSTDENVVCVYWYLKYVQGLGMPDLAARCVGMIPWLVNTVGIDNFTVQADMFYSNKQLIRKVWFNNTIDLLAFRLRWNIPA